MNIPRKPALFSQLMLLQISYVLWPRNNTIYISVPHIDYLFTRSLATTGIHPKLLLARQFDVLGFRDYLLLPDISPAHSPGKREATR